MTNTGQIFYCDRKDFIAQWGRCFFYLYCWGDERKRRMKWVGHSL